MSKLLHFFTCATLPLAAAVFASPPQWNPFTVTLKVNPGKGEVRAESGNQGCLRGQSPATERKGCVRFEEDDIGTVTVELSGGGNATKGCSDPGVKWVITRIELTHEGYSLSSGGSTVPSEKGIFGAPVPQWLEDAFPQTGDYTENGVVFAAEPASATRTASFINLNNHDVADGSRDVWYRVTVTNCADHDISLQSDPRIENDGTTL